MQYYIQHAEKKWESKSEMNLPWKNKTKFIYSAAEHAFGHINFAMKLKNAYSLEGKLRQT